MKCPVCRSELIVKCQERLQTLDEHIYGIEGDNIPLKDEYVCSNNNCITIQEDICWNDEGDYYGYAKNIPWIDNNPSPFGSIARRLNVEIHKKDENYENYFVFPDWRFLPFHGFRVNLEWIYTSNNNGDILSRKPRYQMISKDNRYYVSPWRMLKYSIGRSFRSWQQVKDGNNWAINNWAINELTDIANKRGFDNGEWWRKVSAFVAKILLKNLESRGIGNNQ